MKFKFHIYKIGNLFHFVSNLTEWHFSCRKECINYWLQETGALSEKEKQALKELKKLLKKYNFGDRFIGKPLMTNSDRKAWIELKRWVEPAEYKKIKSIFKIFEPRFEKIWNKEGKNLRKWKKILEKKKFTYRKILTDLKRFFGTEPKLAEDIVLLISGDKKGGGGGANLEPGKFTQEIGLKTKTINDFLPVTWHEYIHSAFRGQIRDEVDKYLKKHKVEKEILKLGYAGQEDTFLTEGIVSSLVPKGFLGEKYFKTKIARGSKSYKQWIKNKRNKNVYTAQDFMSANKRGIGYKTIQKYMEDGRSLDQNYLKKIHQGYRDYLKEIKRS